MKNWISGLWMVVALAIAPTAAFAQASYQIIDANNVKQTIHSFNCSSLICPGSVPMDATGNAFGVTANPFFVSPASGATFPVSGSLTVVQPTGTNLHVVCDSGCSSSSSPTFGGAFPATGTPVGMTQGGNLTALSGTAGALNINISSGSIGNTSFAATQATAASLNATVVPSTLAAWGLVASTQNGATPTNGQLAMGQFNTTPTTITTGNISPFQLDNAGNLLVNVKAGGAGGGAVFGPTAVGSANANPPVVIGGTATGAAGQNVEGVAVKPASTASVATDLSLVTNESPNSQLSVAIGTTADAPCTLPATTTACSDTAIQKAMANAVLAAPTLGAATGGSTPKTLAALSTTPVTVKSSAGQLYRVQCYNPDASNSGFIEIFNTTSITLGTTAPADFVEIGPGSNAGWARNLVGDQYTTAIAVAAVKTFNSATAPSTALDCSVSFN